MYKRDLAWLLSHPLPPPKKKAHAGQHGGAGAEKLEATKKVCRRFLSVFKTCHLFTFEDESS